MGIISIECYEKSVFLVKIIGNPLFNKLYICSAINLLKCNALYIHYPVINFIGYPLNL